MAMLPEVFKAKDHKAMDDFEPVPAGDYTAEIVKSEMKDTKSGNGKYLELRFKILGGEQAKRMLFTRLNIVNPNPDAVEIAHKELKSICDAIGLATCKDSSELHAKPMKVTVDVEPANDGYPPQNRIKNYKPASGAPSGESNPFKK